MRQFAAKATLTYADILLVPPLRPLILDESDWPSISCSPLRLTGTGRLGSRRSPSACRHDDRADTHTAPAFFDAHPVLRSGQRRRQRPPQAAALLLSSVGPFL